MPLITDASIGAGMNGVAGLDAEADKELEEARQKIEDAPKCQDDGASLIFLTDDNKCLNAPHSSGFGCPECGAIYCPFCYDDVRTDPVCEHFIVGSVSSEYFYGNNPFEEGAYHAAQAKYLAKKESFASGLDWSPRQKEAAFGTLYPFLEGYEGYGYGSDYAVDLLEALPPLPEGKRSRSTGKIILRVCCGLKDSFAMIQKPLTVTTRNKPRSSLTG